MLTATIDLLSDHLQLTQPRILTLMLSYGEEYKVIRVSGVLETFQRAFLKGKSLDVLIGCIGLLIHPIDVLAEELTLYRRGEAFSIALQLPPETTHREVRLNHHLTMGNVELVLRLVQDDYSSCNDMVSERIAVKRKEGFSQIIRRTADGNECSLAIASGSGEMSSSFYIPLGSCACFLSVHFYYRTEHRAQYLEIVQTILDGVRSGSSGAAGRQASAAPAAGELVPAMAPADDALERAFRKWLRQNFSDEQLAQTSKAEMARIRQQWMSNGGRRPLSALLPASAPPPVQRHSPPPLQRQPPPRVDPAQVLNGLVAGATAILQGYNAGRTINDALSRRGNPGGATPASGGGERQACMQFRRNAEQCRSSWMSLGGGTVAGTQAGQLYQCYQHNDGAARGLGC